MKTCNVRLYLRLSIASFLGWSALRIAYRYWQIYGQFPGFTLPDILSVAAFLIGIFTGSSLILGLFFAFCQWLVLRPYIKSPWAWMLYQILAWAVSGLINLVLILLFVQFFYGYIFDIWMRACIEALIISIAIAILQNSMLRTSTRVFPWWAVFPPAGIFTGVLLERLNQSFLFIDPLSAILLASVIIAVIASLPTLWVGQDMNPDTPRGLSIVR